MNPQFLAAVDFGKTADDYARYRAGFPEALFERLARFGAGAAGQSLLDLGTGTGTLARGFAQRGCRVVGLDPARLLLAAAARLDKAAGVTVGYIGGKAEALPFREAAFDVVSAGQCWHWFDGARAVVEARRVLRLGGWLTICHFDWIPLPGNVVEATERLIEKHNAEWRASGGNGVHGDRLSDVAIAGFTDRETFSFDVEVPYSHEAWCGRMRASAGVSASLDPAAVQAFDAELAALLRRRFPAEPILTLHRAFAAVCRAP